MVARRCSFGAVGSSSLPRFASWPARAAELLNASSSFSLSSSSSSSGSRCCLELCWQLSSGWAHNGGGRTLLWLANWLDARFTRTQRSPRTMANALARRVAGVYQEDGRASERAHSDQCWWRDEGGAGGGKEGQWKCAYVRVEIRKPEPNTACAIRWRGGRRRE